MVALLPRSAWTDTPFGFSRTISRDRVRFVACHYPADSGLKPPRDGSALSQEGVAQRLRAYRAYHRTFRKWPDIGYPFAVDQAGRTWECAGERIAAHSATPTYPTANQDGLAILFVIGNNERPTVKAIDAANRLIDRLQERYPNLRSVIGHRDVAGASTQCPGDETERLIRSGRIGLMAPETTGDDDEVDADTQRKIDLTFHAVNNIVLPALSRIDPRVAALHQRAGSPQTPPAVDAREVAELILQTLTPESIAAAIPDELAADVVAELGARLRGEGA